jgi:hypothetical protein
MNSIQPSPKLLLLAIPGTVGLGMTILPINISQPQPQIVEMPTEWKVQAVETPKFDKKSMHQALLDRQKQLKDRNLSCDCNGCRVASAQVGITIN